MRESLHQLSLALALPIAVAMVWIVRGDPSGDHGSQTARAYRVELAELALPVAQHLRAPRTPVEWRHAPRASEEATARHRRSLLPETAAQPPSELALEAGSERDRGAAKPLRPSQPDALDSAGASVHPPRPDFAPVPTLPLVATRTHPNTAPAELGDGDETPANGATGSERDGETAAGKAPAPAALAATRSVPVRTPAAVAQKSAVKLEPMHAAVPKATSAPDQKTPASRPTASHGAEKSGSQAIAAPLPSPALAHAMQESKKSIDLSLNDRGREHSLRDDDKPMVVATPQPLPSVFTFDSAPPTRNPLLSETLVDLLDLPPSASDVLAAGPQHAHDAAASSAAASHSPRFPIVFTLLAIPEPASATLLAAALAALAAARRRRSRG